MFLRLSLSFMLVLGFVGSAMAQEAGKGALAVDNVCASTSGEDVVRTYHDNGSLHIKAKCLNAKMDGIVKKYHPNAKIEMKATYKNGVLDGVTKIHDANGKILYRDEYTNGTRTAHMQYNAQGELVPAQE